METKQKTAETENSDYNVTYGCDGHVEFKVFTNFDACMKFLGGINQEGYIIRDNSGRQLLCA